MTSPLAVVGGQTGAQAVVSALEAAIREGSLPPRHEFSIRELADRHGLKVSALVLMLNRLINENLISVYGDVALVSTLHPNESTRLNELFGMITVDLSDRLYGTISPTRLDRIERMLSKVDPDQAGIVPPEVWGQTLAEISMCMLKPIVTEVELRTLGQLAGAAHRYLMIGWSVILTRAGESREEVLAATRREHIDNFYRQLDSYRGGSRRAVLEAVARRENDRILLCEASLTPDNTKPALRIVR